MTADPLFDFSGRTVLVTGGSRGLGREMVLAFARRGADAVIVSRRAESCEAVAREVEALGRRAWPLPCNVSRWEALDGLVEDAWTAAGRIDVLVNNAGSSPLAPSSLETPEALFDKVVALNFKAPFRLMSLVGSRMAAGAGGAIVNISSTGAIRPQPELAPYAGAKAALNAVTEAFAREYAPNVRVNAIMPGRFLTRHLPGVERGGPAQRRGGPRPERGAGGDRDRRPLPRPRRRAGSRPARSFAWMVACPDPAVRRAPRAMIRGDQTMQSGAGFGLERAGEPPRRTWPSRPCRIPHQE